MFRFSGRFSGLVGLVTRVASHDKCALTRSSFHLTRDAGPKPLCPARELVADRDKPAAGSVRAREISPALRALLMAKKPQCPSVFRLCEYSSLHVLLSDCCF